LEQVGDRAELIALDKRFLFIAKPLGPADALRSLEGGLSSLKAGAGKRYFKRARACTKCAIGVRRHRPSSLCSAVRTKGYRRRVRLME
jgi:hypothetical protein